MLQYLRLLHSISFAQMRQLDASVSPRGMESSCDNHSLSLTESVRCLFEEQGLQLQPDEEVGPIVRSQRTC